MNTFGATDQIRPTTNPTTIFPRAVRELLRAITDGVAGVPGLPMALGTLLSLPIRPLALTMIRLDRALAGWHRRRSSEVLGRPVAAPYLPASPRAGERYRTRLAEGATWRDLAWLALSLPLGIAGAAISAGLWIGTLECLLAPLIEPFAPPGVFTPLLFDVDSQPLAWLLVLLSPIIGAAALLVPGLANRLRARLAGALLAPTAAEQLRVGRLAAGRDDAVDPSAAELHRIERDLHDIERRLSAFDGAPTVSSPVSSPVSGSVGGSVNGPILIHAEPPAPAE